MFSCNDRKLAHHAKTNWLLYRSAYMPFICISSSWVPLSATFPLSMTKMTSALRMVDSLCGEKDHLESVIQNGADVR